ncbi:endonuclease MutS2 [Synechocystis sp. PCC 7339]|uniref:endonuclease MutS2 n=1 Tax=unclassified Synechocystis TaxID=2640012 RepID=UPI001BB002AC|nr:MULTISPECIES: endonuclease MutS2 [unclassified Synechocystis]QUS61780.1 endonuclease MutS2 [Synechocystis sp. PCC 7338]UAJ73977.1 endonuclease MutS2 [Synechocystis sp. PCC 7339]
MSDSINLTIAEETLALLEWPRLCQHLSTFTQTPLGAIAARYLLPPDQWEESQALLAQTQAVELIENSPENNWHFKGIADITEPLARVERGGLTTGLELLAIAGTLAGVRRLRRVIEERDDLAILQTLVAEVRTLPELEQAIHHCLGEDGKVAERASPTLGEIRQKLKALREQIQQKLQKIIQRQGNALQEAVITQRGDRFVLPIKAGYKEQMPGIVHDSSASGNTLYVEPQAIVELGNKLRQTRRQEQTEEERILRQLSDQVLEVLPDLEHLLAIATRLDLATARVRYSFWLGAHPPQWLTPGDEKPITLRQLRHPLLHWQAEKEGGAAVVPITLTIDSRIRVIAITGPNTGGKTVTLKTLGLVALMAKVGLYIPAKEPVEMPWFTQILADIGDEQSLQQNLSTFSGHICRIIRILQALPSGVQDGLDPEIDIPNHPIFPSLVLLDEVGAGTDPTEGSALAIALLRHLADQPCLTVATTHYGELKALKYQDARFENASVEFDDQSLSPTYRLLWGIPGRSNALAIAQRLGLPLAVVEQAKERLGGFSEDINQVIAGLENQRREQEQKAANAQKLLQETEIFYEQVSQKAANLQARERELKSHQDQEVQQAIAAAKEEIAKVIRQLQRGKPSAQKAQRATEALGEIQAEQKAMVAIKPLGYQPTVGERIRIPSFGQTAEVIQVNGTAQTVNVTLGLMKMTVPMADIESLDGKKVEPPPKPESTPKKVKAEPQATESKSPPVVVRTEKNTLDCRGDRLERAESRVEKALNQALDSGVLWIIHGKGTGKLRQGVQEYLSHHPLVKSYALAPQNDGGAGVTIAYLR